MQRASHLTGIAEQASERYRVALTAFRGLYDRAIQRPDATGQSARDWLAREIYGVAHAHLQGEDEHVQRACSESAIAAHRDARAHLGVPDRGNDGMALSDEPGAPLEDLRASADEHLWRETSLQLERDIGQTLRALRDFAIRVSIRQQATGWQEGATRTAVMLDEAHPRHRFHDRAGRRWPSQKFIRTLWRGTQLDLYNRAYLLTLARHGETEARIWHPDPSHRHQGRTIALDGVEPSYEDLAQDVFHPNSDALVRAVRHYEETLA